MITGVPTMLSLMLKEQDLLENLDLSSVVAIQVGSAPLSETLIGQVAERFPNARISNGYGTTEAGAGMFGAHPDGIRVPSLSLGHPQDHVEVRLVGGPSADEGVLEVKSPAAMNGYLNLPDKTAEKMSADGWIHTGDIMRRDEHGFFYFVGRDDDMFNCSGENVYPGEVERVLESDARVAECCVVPVPDEVRGNKPVAFVVAAVGRHLSAQEVKDIALAGAPPYMHPREVYFLDAMPLAGTNKIDRRRLTTLAAERASAARE
ncbi:MAG: fatty acid--CoA ligase family protein [Gammaproteobacteria bacterium]